MSDFVNEDLVSFEVSGKKFKFKPITGGDEAGWMSECYRKEGDELVKDSRQVLLCKFRNIKEVPYTLEDIKNVIKVDKVYQDLSDKEKDAFWGKLNKEMFAGIIVEMQKIDSQTDEIKKN